MSALFRPFRVPPTPLATLLTALGVGVLSAAIEVAAFRVPLTAPRVPGLLFSFAAAVAAIVQAASGLGGGPESPALRHLRTGLAGAVALTWVSIDALYLGLFQHHVDEAAVRLGWEAARSKALRVGPADVGALVGSVLVLTLLLTLAHAALSRLPSRERASARARRAGVILILAGLAGAILRERLWDERHDAAAHLAKRLPWGPSVSVRADDTFTDVGWGTDQDARSFAELRALRPRLESARLEAKERPDLLIVHIESLRSDVATKALMPTLDRLGRECWVARHHYSTGNNTGSSVFGLVTGLGGFFYPLSRSERAPALPLVVLRRLGYRNSVYFASNLATYDDIFDIVFKGAVDDTFTAPEGPSDRMDGAVIDHYLESLEKTARPRFDYLVLDSTHYDYAYPKEFERHTPEGTLGLGLKDVVIVEEGINERLRPRGPLVKNRYLNAVEWVDSLLGKLVDGLTAKNRFHTTWIAFVGDHGEAFFEHGTFGHGSGLEDEQVRVPLLLCGPHPLSQRYEYSSHADIWPTWFHLMGLSGAPGPFMSGRSLAVYRPETDVAVSGIGITGAFTSRRFMVAGRGLKVTFDNGPRLPIVAVHDAEDRPLTRVPEDASAVLASALGAKLLRSPATE